MTDTCTIDYYMLAISISVENNSRINSLFRSIYFSNQTYISPINQIIEFLLNKEWDKAKSIWILEVLELQPKRKRFSTFGEENEFFISFIKHFQTINYICTNHSCKRLFYSNDELYLILIKIWILNWILMLKKTVHFAVVLIILKYLKINLAGFLLKVK